MSELVAKARALAERLSALETAAAASSFSEKGATVAKSKAKKQVKDKAKKALDSLTREKASRGSKAESRVIYVGHVPHGFYEAQMEGFFNQFGEVTNVRLSRSKKTGGSKGYAFVEFRSAEVARIAAATMHRYLMGDKQLVAHVVDVETAARPGLFKGRRVLRPPPVKPPSEPKPNRLLAKQSAKRRKINHALGFAYDFPGYVGDDDDDENDSRQPPPADAPAAKKKRKKQRS